MASYYKRKTKKTRRTSSYSGRNTYRGRSSNKSSRTKGRSYSRRAAPQTIKLVIEQVAAPAAQVFTSTPKPAGKARF